MILESLPKIFGAPLLPSKGNSVAVTCKNEAVEAKHRFWGSAILMNIFLTDLINVATLIPFTLITIKGFSFCFGFMANLV